MNQAAPFFILIALLVAVVLYALWRARSAQSTPVSRGRSAVSTGSDDGTTAVVAASVAASTFCGGSSSSDSGC